jgi:amino acid permease
MIPAAFLITGIGGLSAYGFSLIGRVCAFTKANSYREAWEKSINKETSIIPAASCTFKTVCATLAYSMILADTFKAIFATVGFNISRSNTLLGITSVVLLPLCLLKNLSSLAPFSLLGIVGMIYTAFAMGVRYFGGGYAASAGAFLPDVAASLQPAFGTIGAAGVFSPNAFILVCMLSTAYMSHFNAPKFYNELKDNTIERFNILVGSSFAISIATFILMTAFGFLTFGSSSSGLILNNYSNKDTMIGFSRVAVAISLVFSYPLAFAGFRDGVLDLAKVPVEKRSNGLLNKVTVVCLSLITGLALAVKDVSFVLSFGGATLGNALIYVYPALMFRGAVKKMGDKASPGLKKEVKLAMANACLGVGMGLVGAKMALKSLAL